MAQALERELDYRLHLSQLPLSNIRHKASFDQLRRLLAGDGKQAVKVQFLEAQFAIYPCLDFSVDGQQQDVGESQSVQRRDKSDRNTLTKLSRFQEVSRHLYQTQYRAQDAEGRRIPTGLQPYPRCCHLVALVCVQLSLQRILDHGSRNAVGDQLQSSLGKGADARGIDGFECEHPFHFRFMAPFEQDRQVCPIYWLGVGENHAELPDPRRELDPRVLNHHCADRATQHNYYGLHLKERQEAAAFQSESGHDGDDAKQRSAQR